MNCLVRRESVYTYHRLAYHCNGSGLDDIMSICLVVSTSFTGGNGFFIQGCPNNLFCNTEGQKIHLGNNVALFRGAITMFKEQIRGECETGYL